MKRLLIISVLLVALMGCATVNVTPNRVYYETQTSFINAWETYHKAWLALPDTDPRKAEWVKVYHPYFLEAAELLMAWKTAPADATMATLANTAVDQLEVLLIRLAIKKGG